MERETPSAIDEENLKKRKHSELGVSTSGTLPSQAIEESETSPPENSTNSSSEIIQVVTHKEEEKEVSQPVADISANSDNKNIVEEPSPQESSAEQVSEESSAEQQAASHPSNRVVSPDAIVDDQTEKEPSQTPKKTKMDAMIEKTENSSSVTHEETNDPPTASPVEPSPTTDTTNEQAEITAISATVAHPLVPAVSQNVSDPPSLQAQETQESNQEQQQDEQQSQPQPQQQEPRVSNEEQKAVSSSRQEQETQESNEEQGDEQNELQQPEPQPQQQPQQQQLIPNVVGDTPPSSPSQTPPSSPGSVADPKTRSAGLKEPPSYSFQPELLQKLVNEPLKPEQLPSEKYLENFLRVKRNLIERSERRREKRNQLKRSRRGAVLQPPPLLRNDLQGNENTSSHYFHSMKENQRGHVVRCMPESPIINRDWGGASHMSSHNHRQHNQHNTMNSSYMPINEGGPSDHHPYFTPPTSPHSHPATTGPKPEMPSSPTSSLLGSGYEPPVSVGDLTDDGDGQEWTCVFSGVAQSGSDYDDCSFEEHFQRLMGYRLQFDGHRPGAIVGQQARLLPPVDEKTRMANGLKSMEGTLERKGNTYSSDPSVEVSSVLCYGWRPKEEGPSDDYGLEDYWSTPVSRMSPSDRKECSIQVTFEGHTATPDHPWSECFPFGNLFGLDVDLNEELVYMQDRYWSSGVVCIFHWDGGDQGNESFGITKEFALFAPTNNINPRDAKIDTAQLTPYGRHSGVDDYIDI